MGHSSVATHETLIVNSRPAIIYAFLRHHSVTQTRTVLKLISKPRPYTREILLESLLIEENLSTIFQLSRSADLVFARRTDRRRCLA